MLLPAQLCSSHPASQPTAAPHGQWVCGARCGSGLFLIQASLGWGGGRYSLRLQSCTGAGNRQVQVPSLPHGLSPLFQAEDVTGHAMPELPALGQLDAAASIPAREQRDPECVSVCCFSAR